MRRTRTVLAVLTLGVMAAPAAVAHAATVQNGRIFYSIGAILPDPDLSAHSQVWSVNPDGTDVRQLTHLTAPAQAGDPDASPNGKQILYVSNVAGPFQVWVMRANGTGQHRIVADPGHDAFVPRWSPDGTHLLFTRCSTPFGFLECTIATAALDGSGLHDLTGGHWFDFSAAYSPDGAKIAVSGDRAGYASAIFRMPAIGGALHRLTPATLEAFWPDYRPDGHQILFADNFDRPHTSTWTMRADGTHRHDISHLTTPDQNLGFARYSPDGRQVVANYADDSGSWVSTMNPDGSGLTNIVADRRPDPRRLGGVVMKRLLIAAAALSVAVLGAPSSAGASAIDGYLVVDDANTGQIYTLTQLGTNVTQVTHVTGDQFAIAPRWSPDGRRIAFVIVANGLDRMYTMAADGSDVHKMRNDGPALEQRRPGLLPGRDPHRVRALPHRRHRLRASPRCASTAPDCRC